MIVRNILWALLIGIFAGTIQTFVQEVTVVPLIIEAEKYEHPVSSMHDHDAQVNLAFFSDAQAHEHDEQQPAKASDDGSGMLFGANRFTGTFMANMVTGAGFSLLLVGALLLSGATLATGNAVQWAGGAWLTLHLLPALGLPPELPGFPAGALADRQVWWIGTVLCSAIGLYLLAGRIKLPARVVGLVILAIPHAVGAPQPSDITSSVPAILAAEFAVAALAVSLLFWIVLTFTWAAVNARWVRS